MKKRRVQEEALYKRVPFMGEHVEMLRAQYVTQNFSRHFHEEYAVGFIEHGAMRFKYLGENCVASAGCVNLVVPGEVHDGHAAVEEGWRYRMFYLSPEVIEKATDELNTTFALPDFSKGVLEDIPLALAIQKTHHMLENCDGTQLEQETLLLRTLVNWVARHACGKARLPEVREERRAISVALEYLHAYWNCEVSLLELADISGLSSFHFVRVFEKALHITPHAYHMQLRVNKAKQMLFSTMRLADIAAECGFSDQSHLTRQFRRQFGTTPGAYRKIVQN